MLGGWEHANNSLTYGCLLVLCTSFFAVLVKGIKNKQEWRKNRYSGNYVLSYGKTRRLIFIITYDKEFIYLFFYS